MSDYGESSDLILNFRDGLLHAVVTSGILECSGRIKLHDLIHFRPELTGPKPHEYQKQEPI